MFNDVDTKYLIRIWFWLHIFFCAISFQSNIVDGDFGKALPLVVFGGVSVLIGLLSLTIPETLNTKLPKNTSEAINFQKYVSYKCHYGILRKY